MKNGLLIYSTNKEINLFNIGDYIQSIAARQFFDNKIDLYINREELHRAFDEDIKIILNGWFMHEGANWPPSDQIKPLFISFHINKLVHQYFSSENSIHYFKKHEPIGCRDYDTVNFLKSYGIDAYFSGCLTLTLGKTFQNTGNGDQIYFVDPTVEVEIDIHSFFGILKKLTLNFSKIVKLNQRMGLKMGIKNLLRTSFFYRTYSQLFNDEVLLNAHYINHLLDDNFNNDDEKFLYAQKLLEQYASAKYVVTSRIHCALPCLAMNTPVLYVHDMNSLPESSCRLDGILDLFNVIEYRNGLLNFEHGSTQKWNSKSSFKNPNKHIDLANKLIQTVKDFVTR